MITENSNLYAHFDRQITLHQEKELLCTAGNRSYTYQKIADISAQIAHSLTNLGAVPGDRISVQIDKSPQSLCLYLACLRAGLVYHPLNLGYKKSELEYFLGNAEPTLVICDPANVESISVIAQTTGAKVVLTMDANGNGTLIDDANSQKQNFETITRKPDDLAALLYSSGTTGVPKGIMLTHANLLRNTESLVEAWGFTEDDRLLHALPIFHVHGLFVAIGCVMLSGASMRWHTTYNAKAVIQHLPECTVLMGVPTYYTRLLTEPTFDSGRRQQRAAFRFWISTAT